MQDKITVSQCGQKFSFNEVDVSSSCLDTVDKPFYQDKAPIVYVRCPHVKETRLIKLRPEDVPLVKDLSTLSEIQAKQRLKETDYRCLDNDYCDFSQASAS